MAHFALLDENNVVKRVAVVSNECLLDDYGNESEQLGIAFCKAMYGEDVKAVQTSYNGKIRKHFAGIGLIYDASRDAFISPQPYQSWTLNEDTCLWQAPVPMPSDGQMYQWDESQKAWVL